MQREPSKRERPSGVENHRNPRESGTMQSTWSAAKPSAVVYVRIGSRSLFKGKTTATSRIASRFIAASVMQLFYPRRSRAKWGPTRTCGSSRPREDGNGGRIEPAYTNVQLLQNYRAA